MNNKVIGTYLEEFKKHHRYNPTILGKIKRIENYITNLQEENKRLKNLEYKFFDNSGDEESFTLEDYLELGNKLYDLQEENKEWSMIFDTFSKRPYAHKYLEEKRKELNNNKIVGLDSEMIYKDYYDYKSRNEKAREMIRFITYNSERPLTITELNKVYNILGGDKDE